MSYKKESTDSTLLGFSLVFFGVLVLSPDAMLVSLIHLDLHSLLFWRGLFQALCTIIPWLIFVQFFSPSKSINIKKYFTRDIFIISILYLITSSLFVSSARNTNPANTIFLLSTTPVFSVIVGRIFLKDPVHKRTILVILIAMLALGIIVSGSIGGGGLLGDVMALGCAFFLSVQFIFMRKAKNLSMVPAVAMGSILTSMFNLPFAEEVFTFQGSDILLTLIMGCIIMPVAFTLISAAPKYIAAPQVSLVMQLESVFGSVWIWLFTTKVITMSTLVGGALLVSVLSVYFIAEMRSEKN